MGKAIKYYGQLFNKEQNITPEVRKATEAALAYGEALIKMRSPVKTGALRAGWKGKPTAQGIEWQNDVPYTIYQEMGTRFFTGRFMLTQSIPEIRAEFNRQLAKAIGKKYDANPGRSKEQTDTKREKKGQPRASEFTSGVPRFSTPSYDRLTSGATDTKYGFR